MVHLTNYTFSKLCKKLEINRDIDLDFFLEYVYDDLQVYYMLNKFDIKYLFNYRTLLEDEDRYLAEYYEEVPEREDTQSYVFERGGKLKYHLDNNCKFLKKDFVDFNIPSDIQNLGHEVVKEYRDWFRSMGYADDYNNDILDPQKVVFSYNSKFPPKYNIPILNDNYKLVQRLPNSQNTVQDRDFDQEAFNDRILHLKTLYSNEFSCKVLRIISKFDYLSRKSNSEIEDKISEVFSKEFIVNYGINNLKEKFRNSRSIKIKLIKELLSYFKWNYKINDKKFNTITLESFGLECCGNCKQSYNQRIQN